MVINTKSAFITLISTFILASLIIFIYVNPSKVQSFLGNSKMIIGLVAIGVIIYQSLRRSVVNVEGFDDSFTNTSTSGFGTIPGYPTSLKASAWSSDTIANFLNFEATTNPNLIFDTDVIQEQASEAEVNVLLDTGKWPWSYETQKLYMDAIKNNTNIKASPKASMEEARSIYNEKIMKEMLSWNAPEGQFLLKGLYSTYNKDFKSNGNGTYGINSGLITNNNNLIKCGALPNGTLELQEVVNMGNDGITGVHVHKTNKIDFNKLPELLNGFRFLKSPCDPCEALNSPPQYTCPFSLTSKDPSSIWQNLWGLQSTIVEKTNNTEDTNSKTGKTDKTGKENFPLLQEVQKELNNLLPETGIREK